MKGKRRNINRLTVSRSLEGKSFYEKCENPRHITVYTSDTNNGDIIQIILFLISFSFYFKKLLLNKLSDKQGNHIKNNLSVRES
mgnify:CR=1 FL=1